MDLNEVFVFIKVVQSGSFSGAARELGMPNSTVSFKVSSLEKRLNVTLIQRTTRKIHVTPVGQSYFKKCVEGFEAIQFANSEILAIHREPQGQLRITAPADLGASMLPDLVAKYLERYPRVDIELLLTDRRVDLLQEGIDLAIRAGELKDSSLIAKRLGTVCFAPFASPAYIAASGKPTTPAHLKEHKFIEFSPMSAGEWKLVSKTGSAKIPIPKRILVNDLRVVKQLAVSGTGIALLPTFYCLSEVETKQLVRILPEWHSNLSPVHFVYPAQKFVLPKVSAFISLAGAVGTGFLFRK